MHILILPSWYPGLSKTEGIFIFEQAMALSNNENLTVSILNWGPNEFVLKIRKPLQSINTLNKIGKITEQVIYHKKNLTEYKVPFLTWTSQIALGNYKALAKRLLRIIPNIEQGIGKIDIIHAHVTFPAGYLASAISKKLSVPFIITEHSGPFPFREYKTKSGIRDIVLEPLNNASQLIAVSSWLANSMTKYSINSPVVIPNSVDSDFFTPHECAISKHDVPRIFCLSSLTHQKGIGDLLQALRIVKEKGLKFFISIGGTGPQYTRFISMSETLKLSLEIKWLGFLSRQEALEQYQSCDFFVMPSRLESLSMVILEALACGKPVVSTNCGGPADLIDNSNGLLVNPGNPLSLAVGIEKMLKDSPTSNSQSIRSLCLQKYSETVIVDQLMAIYMKVTSQPQKTSAKS